MIKFVNDHTISGVDVTQDGNYVAFIRYGKLYGYTVTYQEDVILDIDEQEKILVKMKELQACLK